MSTEETLNTIVNEEEELDYIEQVQRLKETTVPKEDYLKLKEENKKLFRSLIDGGQVTNVVQEQKKTVKELRNELFGDGGKDMTNLEYCTKVLQLRSAVIADNGMDPFVPNGFKITPTHDDIEAAERLATVLQECIEYAQGDSQLFTNELQRRTRDVRR
ncbi:MAG: hypothetical protein MJZ03_04055 [archaeon]|nr:hypothetical protein [archaeon]